MNGTTRQELIAFARARSIEYPPSVDGPVSEGSRRYRLHVWRVYAIAIVSMLAVAGILVIAHPATGILISEITEPTVDSISLDPTALTLFVGDSESLVPTLHLSDQSEQRAAGAEWSSSDTAVAIVTGGKVTAVAVGTAAITAEQNGRFAVAPVSVVERPSAALTTIAVTPTPIELRLHEKADLTATGTYADETTRNLTASVTWGPVDSPVATVDAAGRVTGTAPGSVEISATMDGITGTATITVKSAQSPRVTGIRIDPPEAVLRVGELTTLRVLAEYSDRSTHAIEEGIEWTSSDPNAVQVADGVATAVDWGTSAVITAEWGGHRATASLEVPPARLTGIRVTPSTQKINQAGQVQLTAVGVYEDGTEGPLADVQWTSLKPLVASVDQNGLVEPTGFGPVDITASVGETIGRSTITVEYEVE